MTPVLERKWTAAAARAPQLARWLSSRLRHDPKHAAGWVVSVYYDTPDWRLLREKEDSDYLKTKVRIRWYEDDAGGLLSPEAFLEVKAKRGGARTKTRLVVPEPATRLQQLSLADPCWMHLPDAARRAGALLPSPLTPVFSVRYRRRRFVDPLTRSRVALDEAIHVGAVHPGRVPGHRRLHLDRAVVEVKGTEPDLPAHLTGLFSLGCRREAFSKYFNCHRLLLLSP